MMKARRTGLVVGATVSALLLCGYAVSRVSGRPSCAMPASWNSMGPVLIQGKAVMAAEPGSPSKVQPAADAGHWAYQSLPVTLDGPGKYVLDFGPVPSSFDFGVSPPVVTFDLPPLPGMAASVADPQAMVTLNGHRYFQVEYLVRSAPAACSGVAVTGWLY
jgi:hypothetical protein